MKAELDDKNGTKSEYEGQGKKSKVEAKSKNVSIGMKAGGRRMNGNGALSRWQGRGRRFARRNAHVSLNSG